MKVKIGKYPKHRFYHNWFKALGGKWEERVSVRIDPWDTWSMDSTLSHIVVPMLEQLRETTHGAPHIDDADRPPQFLGTVVDRNSGDVDEFHFDAWDWILGEMLFAHKSKNEEWYAKFCSGAHDITWVESEISDYSVMTKGPNDTFKIDMEGRDAYQARITNGFRLFGKYYENLWD
jgi:hypothetical protein